MGVNGGAAEGELLERKLMAEARGHGSQALKRGVDDLGPDAIAGQYRNARPHARRSYASISPLRERR